nr:unnamed protein product [Spirometra erinaceieuropaei]
MTLMHGTFGGTESTLEFKQDSDYIFFHNVYGNVEYISVDGVNISKAEEGSHCTAPNDCWELILNKRHLIALGWLNGPKAAFTMHPANSSDRLAVGFQYKKTSTPEYPPLKNGAISVFTKELHGNPSLVHFVLSNVDIGEIDVVGSISKNTSSGSFHVGKSPGSPERKFIYYTGHLESKVRMMKIKFASGRVDNIRIIPYTKPDAPVMLSTFIDYANAFKAK